MNEHKNMQLIGIWVKKGEYNQLVNAIENNEKDTVFEILFEINKRRDL